MTEIELDCIRFEIEHRSVGAAAGPTLHVRERANGRELLRFDCFGGGAAHWHLAPYGADEITTLESEPDPLGWTLGELRRDLAGYLSRAKLDSEFEADPAQITAALERVEQAMRQSG